MIRVLTVGIDGPLVAYAAGFARVLQARGYTRLSAMCQLNLFAHVSRWLAKHRLQPRDFTEQRALGFLRARRRSRYNSLRSRRGLDPMFEYLRECGVVPASSFSGKRGTAERLIAQYASYLSDQRGLAPTTVRRLTDVARQFLVKYGSTRAALRAVHYADVRDFLRKNSRRYSPPSFAGFGSDLRSFLRFLLVTSLVKRSLAEAVPPAVGWRDRAIPSGISASQVQKLLASCDRRSAVGRRDYAILMLLTRLALRAKEIRSLTLDDIDWRQGELLVRGKGSKNARLPLPSDVGAALTAYLRHRPCVTDRQVFLRDRAPHRVLRHPNAIVFRASERAAVGRVGSHCLRRTAATQMLKRGASLSEIAQVLRHTVTETTAIYAKVDRRALRAVVQPWPGARA
jgi:integrase/recombinase XerD